MSPLLRSVLLLLVLVSTASSGLAQGGVAADRIVFIVRHAEKANATDQDPPLSEAGTARALALAIALRDANITDVLVTPRIRTRDTAAPLVEARQLTAHVVPFGASTPEHATAVAAAVRKAKGNAVLVVGHSNTVNQIIAALGGPRMPELCDAQYANLFVVHLPAQGAPSFVRAYFGVPDAPDAGTCAASSMR